MIPDGILSSGFPRYKEWNDKRGVCMADENRTINELSAGAGMLGYNNALPFSPEAEQSVLGAILLDSSCLDLATAAKLKFWLLARTF